MIQKNILKQPKAIVEIQIMVPWSDLESKWNETLKKLAQEVELPGFRKGTAPLELVEQRILTQVQQELLKVVMPDSLMQALQGTDIVPIDYPQYQLISFARGQDLKFNARVTERPKVSVGDYKSIKVVRPPLKEVTNEEVNKIIQDLFNRWKVRQVGTQQVSESTNQGGAQGSVNFNSTTVDSVTPQSATPIVEPNDEFAKGVGATSLEDLKTKIKQDLDAENKYNNELDYEEEILKKIEYITTVDIPEVLIQDELSRMLLSLQRNITERGLLLDEYLKTQNKTLEQLKQEWRPQAEQNVRMELGLAEIARLERVNISDEELQAEIDKIQDQKVKSQFNQQEPRMHLRHALRQTKTLNLLKTLVA